MYWFIYYSKTLPIIPRGTINEDEGQSSAISLFWLGYKSFLLLRYRNHCFLIFLIGLSDSLYELYLESRLIIDYWSNISSSLYYYSTNNHKYYILTICSFYYLFRSIKFYLFLYSWGILLITLKPLSTNARSTLYQQYSIIWIQSYIF